MNESNHCPTCGTAIPADAPEGVCPACALGRGLGVTQMKAEEAEFRRAEMETLATAFPEFELIELIGRGGMGEVYQARQKKLNRLVAIKILPEPFGKSDEYTERFHREAQSLARLNHPNIVTIYDYGEANGLCYFVMEFVDGVDLRRMIEAKTLTAEEALRIVPQVCDALQFAHDQGIVHRDIKPANILLDKQGRVKIADFGLAKIVGKTANDLTLTATGDVMGTAEYMAPEQRRASQSVDHRADIYSLGVVFYEMLTGEVPMGKFDPPSQRVQVDVRLDAVVLRTLEREPERRYQQVSEVKSGVATICESAPAPAKTTRRFPFKFTALCTLFFAAVWFAAGALWNWRGPGVIAGGVMLAAAIGLALFQARTHFPIIVENYRLDSRWRIFTRVVLALGQAVVAYYLIVGATLQIAERVAWPFTYLDREEFETLYKGQEFKLLRELSAFAKDIPKAELVPERADWSAGLALLGNQTPNRAFFTGFGILAQLAFGFVFFANIVNALVTPTLLRWRLDPRWREVLRPIVAITIALVGGWCMVQFRSVLIELTGGRLLSAERRTAIVREPLDAPFDRVETELISEGYFSGNWPRWALASVPEGRTLGHVLIFNAWKLSPFDRWQWRAGRLVSVSPLVSVRLLSSEAPAETLVTINVAYADANADKAACEALMERLVKAAERVEKKPPSPPAKGREK